MFEGLATQTNAAHKQVWMAQHTTESKLPRLVPRLCMCAKTYVSGYSSKSKGTRDKSIYNVRGGRDG